MAFSSWICSKNTRNMFLKIVHPGGHVELHDRPILAAEIIYRNPRCVVSHPNIFQQPWAVVAPETELLLGQKFYVVPISTIRKLQRLSPKYSPSSTPTSESQQPRDPDDDDDSTTITCWFFTNKNDNNKTPNSSRKHRLNDEDSISSAEEGVSKDMEEDDKSCLVCKTAGVKSSDDDDHHHHKAGDASADRTTARMRKRGRGHAKGSPKRHAAFDQWQPSLASITETEE